MVRVRKGFDTEGETHFIFFLMKKHPKNCYFSCNSFISLSLCLNERVPSQSMHFRTALLHLLLLPSLALACSARPGQALFSNSLSPATFSKKKFGRTLIASLGVFPHCPAPTCVFFSHAFVYLGWRNVRPNPAGWAAAARFPLPSFHLDLAPFASSFCALFSFSPSSSPAAFWGLKTLKRVNVNGRM